MTNRPINVLYAAHASNLTGASQSLIDLLTGLDRTRVNPEVLLREHGPIEGYLDTLDVPYTVVPYMGDTKSVKGAWASLVKRGLFHLLQPAVTEFLRKGNFDIVHNNSLLVDTAMFAARKLNIPYVCHIRELIAEDHGFSLFNEKRTMGLISDANAVIFISRRVAEKYALFANDASSHVVPDAVNPARYICEHEDILKNETVRMVLAGRIVPGKGQLDAIKAVSILSARGRDAKLTLVGSKGSDSYFDACSEYIAANGLSGRVRFIGFTNDLRDIRCANDISLVCSKQEGLGRVTIEGMMSGCLVIGANSGATPEIVRDKDNGLLYQEGDPYSLAESIEWAINHQAECNVIARRAKREAMQKYAPEPYTKQLLEIYEEIVSGTKE